MDAKKTDNKKPLGPNQAQNQAKPEESKTSFLLKSLIQIL
jgi:hypothetical protein